MNLDVKEGEILGIGGLAGQGKLGIPNGVMGLYEAGGTVEFDGKPIPLNNPRKCLDEQLAFVSEDRRGVGLLLDETLEWNVAFPAMHGEKTGVGSLLAVAEYKRLAKIGDIAPYVRDYAPVPDEHFRSFFGERLAGALIKENEHDCLAAVTKEALCENWSGIREMIDALPSVEYLYGLLEALGAKRTLESIGVSDEQLPELLTNSPLIRNRLTLMRARRMMDIERINKESCMEGRQDK